MICGTHLHGQPNRIRKNTNAKLNFLIEAKVFVSLIY